MNKTIIEYGGIDCGYLELKIKNDDKIFQFIFDELLRDPLPQLVELFNYFQKCIEFDKNHSFDKRGRKISIDYKCEIELGYTYDDRITAVKISAEHCDLRNFVRFELLDKKISFEKNYLCVEWAEMFKKFFSDLLNDKYFPYSYPCFWYICEDTDDKIFDDFEEKVTQLHPDWNIGDVLNYGVAEKIFSLSPSNKIYFENYKKMLTDYIIPENFFKE